MAAVNLLTSNFQTVEPIVVLFGRGSFNDFAQKRSTNVTGQTIARFASTLVTTTTQTPTMNGFTFGRLFLTPRRISKFIWTRITLPGRALIYVETLVVHFQYSNGSVSANQKMKGVSSASRQSSFPRIELTLGIQYA